MSPLILAGLLCLAGLLLLGPQAEAQTLEDALLRASNADKLDKFGTSVAIDGDRAIVGAPTENGPSDNKTDAGAAYIFERSNEGWTEVQILRASNAEEGDEFGESVAMDGRRAIVGANGENGPSDNKQNAGAAYIFERTSSGWPETEDQILRASNADSYDRFGKSVAIDGNRAIVGAMLEDGPSDNKDVAGAAYVFERTSGGWPGTEDQILRASNADEFDRFGKSVAIDGDRAIVGAGVEDGPSDNKSGAGATYVFERTSGSWPGTEDQILRASNADKSDRFGASVAIDGSRAIVGAPGKDGPSDRNKRSAGAAYVFKRTSGGWPGTEDQILRASNADSDLFGESVVLNGNRAIGGARFADGPSDNTSNAGAAYVFRLPSSPVAQLKTVTNITASAATVEGLVNPGGDSTTGAVEYRKQTASAYQRVTTAQSPLTGLATDTVSARLSGLQAATPYEVRLVARNSAGADTSQVGTFTTPPSGPVATFNRTIRGTEGNDAGWRMLSVPPADVTRAQLEDDLDFGRFSPFLYRWTGADWAPQDASTDRLPRGEGFILYFFDDNREPLTPTGISLDVEAGSENLLADAEVGGLSQSETFHLLGNPYASAFDLDSLAGGDLPAAGFQATVQVWNPDARRYEQIVQGTPNSTIAAWQGFFAQRSILGAGDTSLTFAAGGKRPRPGALIGSERPPKTVVATEPAATTAAKAAPREAEIELQVTVTGENGDTTGTDQATLWLSEKAKSGYDAYEARDLAPPPGNSSVTASFPIIRSDGTVEQRALASVPYPTGSSPERTVPLAIEGMGTRGTGTLSWANVSRSQVPNHWTVELTDTRTGTTVDLRSESYSFSLSTDGKSGGPKSARFRLFLQAEPLPVELTAFEGTPTGHGIRLTWETASEQNNAEFRLQRRRSEADADRTWTTVGQADGAGTTNQPQRYQLTDTDLPAGADSLTYRLKQIDLDGSASLSESITVGRGEVTATALNKAYPNPASKQVTVHYAVPASAEDARLALYDVMGRTVRRLPVTSGRTTDPIDVSGLASGTYVLRLQAEGTSATKQVTVVR